MKKIHRLTERDLTRLVKKVIKEQKTPYEILMEKPDCKSGDRGYLFLHDSKGVNIGSGWGLSSSNDIANVFCKVP